MQFFYIILYVTPLQYNKQRLKTYTWFMHVCFLLITYVNGIATCSVACIKKQVCMSAPQYSIISLPHTLQTVADRIKFKDYIASCKQTLDQAHGFNTQHMIWLHMWGHGAVWNVTALTQISCGTIYVQCWE
jgi:hypothetical protein